MGKGKSIRTRDWKLNAYANGEGELYDMKSDLHELTNLFGDPAYEPIVHGLERKLLLWSMAKEDRLPMSKTVSLNYEDKRKENKRSKPKP